MMPDFFVIPAIVKTHPGLRPSDWFVYATIYWLEKMRGERCFASNATIAKIAGMSDRTVRQALDDLEKAGFIVRTYKDESRTIREEIRCTITFSKTLDLFGGGGTKVQGGGGTGVPPRGGTGVPQSSNKRAVKDIAAKDAAPATPFSFEETRKKWYDGEDARFQLLAWFFDKKKLWGKFKTKEQATAAVTRHIRIASRIVKAGWTQKDLNRELERLLRNEKMRDEWQLETIEKYLTK